MAKVKAEVVKPSDVKEDKPLLPATVELVEGYNKNMTLYFAGGAIHFKDGKATVKAEISKALKQGGYVK